jgi:hypothetical protein
MFLQKLKPVPTRIRIQRMIGVVELHFLWTRGHIEKSLRVNHRAEIIVLRILEKRRSWAKLRGIGDGIRPCVSIQERFKRVAR